MGPPRVSFWGNDLDQSAKSRTADRLIWIENRNLTAPYTGDLELAVIDKDGPHTVAFACRRVVGGIAAETNKRIKVRPTHWRVWPSPVERTET